MRRKSIFLSLLLFSFLLSGIQTNKIYAARIWLFTGQDSLKYLGHSSVKIKTSEGKVIYIDPFAGTDYTDPADIVLVTHQHYDHNVISLVTKKSSCSVITNYEAIQNGNYQSFSFGNIKIDAIAAYYSYHIKSQCVGYVIETGSVKVYHAGDTGKISEMADLAAKNIDYALLPMDGIYTMTPEEATQAADMIKAKYYIPIHTESTISYDALVARFTAAGKILVSAGETLELKKTYTSIDNYQILPQEFILEQNYPNPFNPSTNIEYSVPEKSLVQIKIYDTFGKEMETLVNRNQAPGRYHLSWYPKELSSGVYFYRIQAGKFNEIRKMIYIR